MKGKKFLILASILAGTALVGGTFAAWAVTDQADPFGLKISPGSISEDTVNFVTLSYGDRTYANVENLAVGQNRLAATIGLKADTSNSESYTGKFSVSLLNQTVKEGSEPLLIDYLTVNVYDVTIEADANGVVTTNVGELTPKGTYNKASSSGDISVTVTDNVQKLVYVTVSLANTVEASTLQTIKSDIVYLQFDWNSNGTGEVSTSTVYFNYGSAGKNIRCYAWTASKVNAEYPGAAMTDLGNGLYSYELSMDYSKLLFVDYTGNTEVYKTADLELTTTARTQTPCYTKTNEGGSWGVVPTVLEAGYYLVGSINNWTPSAEYKLTQDSETPAEYAIEGVQLSAGSTLKVRNADGSDWKTSSGVWEGCGFTLDGDGNIVIAAAGVYTVHLNTADAEGHYVWLSK